MNTNQNYEKTDANTKTIFIAGIVLFIAVTIIAFLMFPLMKTIWNHTIPKSNAPVYEMKKELSAPNPILEVLPSFDLKVYREEMDEKIHAYGWVDKDKQIVRTPISVAKENLLKLGLPSKKLEENS